MRGRRFVVVVCICSLLLPAVSSAQPLQTLTSVVSDTVVIATKSEGATPPTTSVQLSRETFDRADVVLIARDDTFADALASGTLQGDGPLLLVPSAGPVPAEVLAQIADLGARRAVVLGGEAAVAPAVVAQLQQAGLAVERRAGGSRIETAVAIAADRPAASTAILARAFSAEGASPTQAFADALAAGGLAAAEGLPILLTDTATLSAPTRMHLQGSGIEEVLIIGGTAAVSQAVEDEVRSLGMSVDRLAGEERAATAIAVAKARGADSAGDVARFVLLDGGADDAWVAGFAAASHSARLAAPIVLGTAEGLPPATQAWIAGGQRETRGAGPVEVAITCAIARGPCEQARVALGLPARASITYDPGSGVLAPGAPVTIHIAGAAADVIADGSCLDAPTPLDPAGGTVQRGAGTGPCTLTLELVLPHGATQTEQVDYAGQPAGPLLLAPGLCAGFREPALSADGATVAVLTDPAAGCEAVSPGGAMAFIDVADGSTTLLPMPSGWQRSTFDGVVILSPDGRVALVDLQVPGDFASRTPWVFDRATGQVRPLADTDPSLAGSGPLVTGGPQAWNDDGRVLGWYCGSASCGQAVDPLTGALSAPGDACRAWWAVDPDGTICDPGTTTAAGASGLLFEGSRFDGSKVEVAYDLTTGAVQVAPTPCEPTPPGAGWSVDDAGTTIHRACRTGRMGTAQMSLVVTPITGSGQIVATHTAPAAPLPLQLGIGDDRYVPLRYAIDDGATGRGVLHDLVGGAHVELGTVRGVPQLHAPGSFVVVATDAGLERLPVPLGG